MAKDISQKEFQQTVTKMRSLRSRVTNNCIDINEAVGTHITIMDRVQGLTKTHSKLRNGLFNCLVSLAESYRTNKWADDTYDKLLAAAETKTFWGPKQREKLLAFKTRNFDILTIVNSKDPNRKISKQIPRRLRVAERVLQGRTSRFLIVMEKTYDDLNAQAVLRTAEALGIQHVWTVKNPEVKHRGIAHKITRGNDTFLSVRSFTTSEECLKELKDQGWTIWATDLSQESVRLDSPDIVIPEKLAIVFGTEATGVSEMMLNAADKRVYLPLYGFSESLNLSVAAALVLQKLFQLCPEARGNLTDAEKQEIRSGWYEKLSKPANLEFYKTFIDNPPAPAEELRRGPDEQHKIWIPRKKRRAAYHAQQEQTKKMRLEKEKQQPPGEDRMEE
mmetsp:Transcript_19147/g.21331  ORF Transcript_19147/g.21331 Transcript_19147/m.21331 type:complete len:390 (-) Transcript_19147:39-1208(-)